MSNPLTLSEAESLHFAYDQAVATGGDPRIMLINDPSNPTGQVFPEATVDMIAKFCRQHSITLISDEIYSDISFGDMGFSSTGGNDRFGTCPMIITGGLSKVSLLPHITCKRNLDKSYHV